MSKISLRNFLSNEALATENATLKTERDGLLAKLKDFEIKDNELTQTKAALEVSKAELTKVTTEHATALESVKAEYQVKVDGLTKDLEAAKVSVNKEVVAHLTSVGIQAGVVKEETTETISPAQIVEQYKSLTKVNGREAQAFYEKHRMVILKNEGLVKQ